MQYCVLVGSLASANLSTQAYLGGTLGSLDIELLIHKYIEGPQNYNPVNVGIATTSEGVRA